MGLLSDVLLLPLMGPARGLYFILEQIRAQVDEEQLSQSSDIEDALMSLAMRYELGDLSEQAYAEQEAALLERLNEIRNSQEYGLLAEEGESGVDEAIVESENREFTDES